MMCHFLAFILVSDACSYYNDSIADKKTRLHFVFKLGFLHFLVFVLLYSYRQEEVKCPSELCWFWFDNSSTSLWLYVVQSGSPCFSRLFISNHGDALTIGVLFLVATNYGLLSNLIHIEIFLYSLLDFAMWYISWCLIFFMNPKIPSLMFLPYLFLVARELYLFD